MKFWSALVCVFLFSSFPRGVDGRDAFLKKYMEENRIKGTVVFESSKTRKTYVYNPARSNESFLPASTFKIVHTLIILQERALKDENEMIKWDGRDRGYPGWNRDQNLTSAFPVSCVWFYQELAKKIGNDKYLSYLGKMHYGNAKTGANVDSFWLDGDLRISAVGQIDVLKNIFGKKYSFDNRNYEILKTLMVVDKKDNYIVRAKTGTVAKGSPNIGWYVGYIETRDDVWFFAGNLDMVTGEQSGLRKEMIYAALREIKIIR
jgi:beta-lactamase class D